MRTLNTIVLLALPCQVLALSDMDVLAFSDQSYTDDLPIVLSATRLAQPISEAPVAMTVIDRNMIEASGARNIPDVLRLVPGFQVGYFDGNSPVVAYHGHSGEHNTRLQVLIDGRSVYDPARNAVPWSDLEIDLDDIERIEVTRGPNASTYGNNSFFSVISITTRHAVEAQGQYVRIRAGTHDTTDATYTFGNQSGSLDYRVTVNTTNDNGTDFLRDETAADGINYRADWQISTSNRVMFQGGYKDISLGDHEALGQDQQIGHDIDNKSAFQYIKWEHLPQIDSGFTLQYYYNQHTSIEVSPTINFAIPAAFSIFRVRQVFDPYDFFYTIDVKSERHDLEFNQFVRPLDSLRLVWGASARQDQVDGKDLFENNEIVRHNLYRGYTHGEWRITDDLLINAGYMIEYNDISGNDRSPRIAFIHHLNNHHTLRLGASKATRTPTLFEEYGQVIFRNSQLETAGMPTAYEAIYTQILSPGNLNSETINSIELGYFGEYQNNKLTLDVKLFKDKTSGLMGLITAPVPTPGSNQIELNDALLGQTGLVALFLNKHETRIKGGELALDYKPDKYFTAHFFYSRINIDSNDLTGEGFILSTSAPEDSGGLMLTQRWRNNMDTSLMLYRSEDFNWTDRIDNNAVQAYTKIDTRIAKHWQTAREKLTLALIGQNLLGTHFDYNTTDYQPSGAVNRSGSPQDRRVFIELGLKFN